MLELIIFSKDRACQLDLLLRSIKREFAEWSQARTVVLFTYSSGPLRYSYERVRCAHPEVEFVCERDLTSRFKETTLSVVGERPLVAFLVDDDVFKEQFSLQSPELRVLDEDPELLCVSLRMDPAMDYVYTQDRPMARPVFRDGNIWDWTLADGDWGYPMSLDGHIFRTAEIVPLLHTLEFHDPNSLEFEMAKRPLPNPLAICFDVAKVINLPLNRVQDTAPNRHAGVDARRINLRFLRGERLSLRTVAGVRSRSPHHEPELQWEAWEGGSRWERAAAVVDAWAAPTAKRLHQQAQRGSRLCRRLVGAVAR